MSYSTIRLEKTGSIATITLNQPERLNRISHKMMAELLDVLAEVAADKAIRAAILAAAGNVFSAGGDINEHFEEPLKKRASAGGLFLTEFFSDRGVPAFLNLGKPIIAAINGPAIGLGCSMCLACDIRIAAPEAKLSFAFVRMGVAPEFGSTYFLPRLIGLGKSLELLYTGRTIEAVEAAQIGLVNKVVAADKLMESALELAQAIAKSPPLSVRLIRDGMYRGVHTDIDTALKWEHLCYDLCTATADHAEAIKAFLEKRPPEFQGK